MGTRHKIAQGFRQAKGDYLLAPEGNQGKPKEYPVKEAFEQFDTGHKGQSYKEIDHGHGYCTKVCRDS
jgi:hypothetical protein